MSICIAVQILDKIDFKGKKDSKAKDIRGDSRGNHTMIKVLINHEYVTNLTLLVPNKIASKYGGK